MDFSFGGVFHILSCCIRRQDCKRQDLEYQRLSVFWLQHRQQPVCQEENKNLQSTYSSCTLVIFAAVAQSIHLIVCLICVHHFFHSGSQVVILSASRQQRPQIDLQLGVGDIIEKFIERRKIGIFLSSLPIINIGKIYLGIFNNKNVHPTSLDKLNRKHCSKNKKESVSYPRRI